MKTIAVIGAGQRGEMYARRAKALCSDSFKIVAVAEPIKSRRDNVKNQHNIPDEMCFEGWEQLLAQPKLADIVIIATMDRDHYAPTMAAIQKGYNIMIEKPISPEPQECLAIEKAAREKGVFLLTCFVLRYTPFFNAIKQLIKDGVIGDVYNIQHAENVGNLHQSHSFVRGNWGNSKESSFMLLQKSSHDMDILQWLIEKPCKRVSSFGSLSYFTAENAPEGAPERCIEGCPHADTCYYNAVKLYLESDSSWFRTAATKLANPTDSDVENALRTTQYGKCVFKCNNDVVDHQIVNMEFEGGVTANFTMSAFNKGGRELTVMGTKGTISGNMADNFLTLYSFQTCETTKIPFSDISFNENITGGHGGGDDGIILELKRIVESEEKQVGDSFNAVNNHLIAFAAEESRLNGTVVDVEKYRNNIVSSLK